MGGAAGSAGRPIDVRLVGGLVLERGGRSLERTGLSNGHAEVAFARLAMDAGTIVSRQALADAIWDEPPLSWQSGLRNLVAALRRWLSVAGIDPASLLVAAGDGYRLDLPSGSTVDLPIIEQAVAVVEALHRGGDFGAALVAAGHALEALGQEVLAGASSEWVDKLRTELRALRLRLERVTGEAALATRDAARAEQMARRLVAAEPLREDGHRLLMLALRGAGNGAEALAAYDRCRRMLSETLGAMPSPATEAVFLEILAEEGGGSPPEPGPTPLVAPAGGPLWRVQRQTPFVGRAAVLDRLTTSLRSVGAAGPGVVRVSGEAGLGKTRLAAELAARASQAGMSVLYGRVDDRIGVAYGAVLEALETGTAGMRQADLVKGLGEHAAVMAGLLSLESADNDIGHTTGLGELDSLRINQGIVATLRLLAGPNGALLVLDDLQWATRLELGVIEAIAREDRLAVLLLLLERAEAPGTADASEVVSDLRLPAQRVRRVMLEPLTVAELADLARVSGLDPISDDLLGLAADVRKMTGGNPLLASEFLRSWRSGRDTERPARIDLLVRERLAVLPPSCDEMLRIAAVAGLEFDPHVVTAASDASAEQAGEVFKHARQAGLLVAATRNPRWLAFRHALVRSVLLDSLPAAARARLHQRLGVALEPDAHRDRVALVSTAYHFGSATAMGEWRRAVRYGLPVARAAFDAGVYEDVVTVSARALQALADAGDPDPDMRLDLEILLGGAQRALGDRAGYSALLTAFANARERGDAVRMADAALAFTVAGAASEEAYIDDSLLDVYEEALARLGETDLERRALLLGHLASARAWRRSGADGIRDADEALSLARHHTDRAILARVLTTTRRAMAGLGVLARQGEMEDELSALAEHFDDPGLRVRVALWRFETMVQHGRGGQLEALIAAAAANVGELRIGNYHHSLAYRKASLALLRGELDLADELVERAAAVGLSRGLDPLVVQAIRVTQLAGLRHEQHRLDELRDQLSEFDAVAGIPSWDGIVGVIDAALGRCDDLGEKIDRLLAFNAERGPTMVVPVGLVAQMAEPIAILGCPDRAAVVYEMTARFSGQGAYTAYFAGPIDYHLGVLARGLGRDGDARRHMHAAAQFSGRLGAPRWSVRCRAALVELESGSTAEALRPR